MFFRELYDQSLAQASYVIGCQATGEAIVVDPLRDPAPYLAVARAEGLRITHVTETHIHADFVSGARELRAATNARLYLSAEGGDDWQYAFAGHDEAVLLHDGDRIMVGNIALDVMHTPGHTPEHLSFVVTDTPRAAGPMGILTGDFVFVGDVGRPDLLERAAGLADTMEAGARTLFRSLQRFRALPDHLQVWPGHGAGSACGKALGAVPSSTVGYEKLSNWGVAATSEQEFVTAVLEGQPEPPRYFASMKRINREGPPVLGAPVRAPRLAASAVVEPAREDRWLIDLRTAEQFAEGYIDGSLSVPFSKSFSTWVGSIVPVDHEIVLLADAVIDGHSGGVPESVSSATRDLSRIGYDRIAGWVDVSSALDAWRMAGHSPQVIPQAAASELRTFDALHPQAAIIDVRGRTEWDAGHLAGARHIPLGDLRQRVSELPAGPLYVHCQSGARSAVATSLLHRLGRRDAVNVRGGYAAIKTGEP